MGLYIVPAGDDKPPQGNGRRPEEIALLQTGMFNPIKHFLVPLCCCLCSLAWHHLLRPLAVGTAEAQGRGWSISPRHLLARTRAGCWRCLWEGRMALMGDLVLLWGSELELIIPLLAQCFVQPLIQDVGGGAFKGQSHCCHQQFIKLPTAPRENLQSHLKRNGLLKRAPGTRWERLGVYQCEMDRNQPGVSVFQNLTLHFPSPC